MNLNRIATWVQRGTTVFICLYVGFDYVREGQVHAGCGWLLSAFLLLVTFFLIEAFWSADKLIQHLQKKLRDLEY